MRRPPCCYQPILRSVIWFACALGGVLSPLGRAEPYVFNTFAGSTIIGNIDGAGTGARFDTPVGLTIDREGNLYVADAQADTVRKITPDGTVTTLAGKAYSPGYVDGPGAAARFSLPGGIAADSTGILYVADAYNNRIRKITPAGLVSTHAGSGAKAYADGPLLSARFNYPLGVGVDPTDSLVYVADTENHVLRMILNGINVVSTNAGAPGVSGNATGIGDAARFKQPAGVVTDANGVIFLADTANQVIRRIDRVTVTNYAGRPGIADYIDGGPGTATLYSPMRMAFDRSGNLIVAQNARLRLVRPDGSISTLAGGGTLAGDGVGTAVKVWPSDVAVDRNGNIYFTDTETRSVRKVSTTGFVSTFAGATSVVDYADGSGFGARFYSPVAVTEDRAGNLYIADRLNNRIRKVSITGEVTTVAGGGIGGEPEGSPALQATFSSPMGIALDAAGNIYVSDSGNYCVRRISPAGIVTTFAGRRGFSGTADGPADVARFSGGGQIAIDRAGNLYVSALGCIRKITPAGFVSTYAGVPGVPANIDGPIATARLAPGYLAFDGADNLFFSQAGFIRKITPQGIVSTYAGDPGYLAQPNVPELNIDLRDIQGITFDPQGRMIVIDGRRIRRITASGAETLAGDADAPAATADGEGETVRFRYPCAIVADRLGRIMVCDGSDNVIRRGLLSGARDVAITTQPAPQGAQPFAEARFSIAVTAIPAPIYQWQRQAAGTTGYVALTNDATFSGVDTASLTVIPPSSSFDGDSYRCVVTNAVSSVTSNAAILRVGAPAVFSSLNAATFIAGAENHLTLLATPASPPPTFQMTGSNLPPWLRLNAVSGDVAGTPPDGTAGVFTFTLSASNGIGAAAMQTFTLRVVAVPRITAASAARQVVDLHQSLSLAVSVTAADATYQWKRNGVPIQGANGTRYVVTDATAVDQGYYQCVVTNAAGTATSAPIFVSVAGTPVQLIGWGGNNAGQITTPADVGALSAIGAGDDFTLALRRGGDVLAWGSNVDGRLAIPADLSSVVAVAAGAAHSLALKSDGTVIAWGSPAFGATTVPAGLANVVAIGAGAGISVALKADGTVAAWGDDRFGVRTGAAAQHDIVSIAVGAGHVVALRADGTVVAWGQSDAGQTNVAAVVAPSQAGYANVVAVAAGERHSLALRASGGVVAWGDATQGATSVPANLADVVAIAAGRHSLALKSDGTLVAWGPNNAGQGTIPANLPHVVAIAAAQDTSFALCDPNTYAAPVITVQPHAMAENLNNTAVFTVGATSPTAITYQWMKNGFSLGNLNTYAGAYSATLYIGKVSSLHEGMYSVRLTNAGGSVTSTSVRLSVVAPPTILTQPLSRIAAPGSSVAFTVVTTHATEVTYQWLFNGAELVGANGPGLAVGPVTAANYGSYAVRVTFGGASVTSDWVTLGALGPGKVLGAGSEVGANIVHANGNVYDQVLLTGAATTITADPGEVTRISFIDLTDDIVQVEFAGAGTLSLSLDSPSGPAAPLKYNQPGVQYMKGHATITITGANETTNVSVFSVGRANAVNQALFRSDVTYDGFADIASLSIASDNGKFGGVRTANASYFATRGLAGIHAPGVQFTGPVFVGDVQASETARPVLLLGAADEVRIAGGDLGQTNGRPVDIKGFTRLRFVDGSNSHGTIFPAQYNQARLERDGTVVTDEVVVNPDP